MIVSQECRTCRGAGRLDYYVRRDELGNAIRIPRDAPPTDETEDGPCFRCGGSGTYEVELVRCKIF